MDDTYYSKENIRLEHTQSILDNPENKNNPLFEEYQELAKAYKQLHRQDKKLIRISDQLQRSLEAAKTEIEHISELSKQISNSLEFNTIFRRIFQIFLVDYSIDGGFLLTGQKSTQTFRIEKCNLPEQYGVPEDDITGYQEIADKILNFCNYRQTPNTAFFCDNMTADTVSKEVYEINKKPFPVKSFNIIPISINQEPFGLLLLLNLENKIILSREKQRSLLEFTNQIAVAIKNSFIYEDSEASRIKEIEQHIETMKKINHAYFRFVPKALLNMLDKDDILTVKLGDQIQKDMTILFADIRSFTTLSEKMTPEENFNFINSYLSYVGPLIRKHNGYIDKYIGDGIMALFPQNPQDAVNAAIDIQLQVTAFNDHLQKENRDPIRVGIGIHFGKLMLGIIGEEERMEGTVISDAVNMASRLETLTKHYSSRIIISHELFGMLDNINDYIFRFLGITSVKGKTTSVSIFEILDGDTQKELAAKIETKDEFEMGVIHFEKGNFTESKEKFLNVLNKNPDDHTAACFLKQINEKNNS